MKRAMLLASSKLILYKECQLRNKKKKSLNIYLNVAKFYHPFTHFSQRKDSRETWEMKKVSISQSKNTLYQSFHFFRLPPDMN